jgi:cytochrome c
MEPGCRRAVARRPRARWCTSRSVSFATGQGRGQPNDRLVGGQGTLASKTPVRTIGSYWPYATTVFDYVRRAMPYIQPQSLSNDEVYAVTAYLLQINGIIGEQDEMNAQTLPKVKMPNQANFIVVYPSRAK